MGGGDVKIIRVVSEDKGKKGVVRAIERKKGVKTQRRKFCVNPERTAGDGRIMTEGGASLTPPDLPLHPAAGKWVQQQHQPIMLMGYPVACLQANPSSSAAAIHSHPFTVTSALADTSRSDAHRWTHTTTC